MPKKSISLLQLYDILRDLAEQNEQKWDEDFCEIEDDSYYCGYSDALSHFHKRLQNLRLFVRGSGEE